MTIKSVGIDNNGCKKYHYYLADINGYVLDKDGYLICHREDGPAKESINEKQWYYLGEKINCSTQEEFERILKMKIFW